MARKGTDKRKSKAKSKTDGNTPATTRAGTGSVVQTLVKDTPVLPKKGADKPASESSKH